MICGMERSPSTASGVTDDALMSKSGSGKRKRMGAGHAPEHGNPLSQLGLRAPTITKDRSVYHHLQVRAQRYGPRRHDDPGWGQAGRRLTSPTGCWMGRRWPTDDHGLRQPAIRGLTAAGRRRWPSAALLALQAGGPTETDGRSRRHEGMLAIHGLADGSPCSLWAEDATRGRGLRRSADRLHPGAASTAVVASALAGMPARLRRGRGCRGPVAPGAGQAAALGRGAAGCPSR